MSEQPIADERQSGLPGLKQVAENIWIFDAAPLRPAGLPLPVRMTIIRLSNNDLLLHFPTRYSIVLRTALEQLGKIKYLLAPAIAHWMFVPEWQRAVPETITFAVPGLGSRAQAGRGCALIAN